VSVVSIRWASDHLELLDQRALPGETRWIHCQSVDDAVEAIRTMIVRGAPALALAAGYGLVLAAMEGEDLTKARARLAAARPTAVNLAWMLDRLAPLHTTEALLKAVQAEHAADLALNRRMGAYGADTLPDGGVYTHCNTGALATAGHGTALGVIRTLHARGRDVHVYAGETRPWLQGARLTSWECLQEGIPCTLVADSASGALMGEGRIQSVIVGCDRVAKNGDVANKIGTRNLAILAHFHGIPFYVAMPFSTLDRNCPAGASIPIEQRPSDEVTHIAGRAIAPAGVHAANPAFDITPARLVTAFITEHGVIKPPFGEWPTVDGGA
jgi:methylthioribose-1-phosphate isomerase